MSYWAHPTAVIDTPASIGDETKIWHFTHVMAHARIGARCSLGQNVFVASRAVVGDGCRIQNNVSIYDGVELQDDVFVGPSAVFTNVINPRAFIHRQGEIRRTRGRARRDHRSQRDDRVRHAHRAVRVRGGGRGGDPGRAGLRAGRRRAGAANRLDLPLRGHAAQGGRARADVPMWRLLDELRRHRSRRGSAARRRPIDGRLQGAQRKKAATAATTRSTSVSESSG